jgi:hypothetical protein
MDTAEAKIARRACLAVMESAAGAGCCALAADNESTVRAATVAIVPEMRFMRTTPLLADATRITWLQWAFAGLLCAARS